MNQAAKRLQLCYNMNDYCASKRYENSKEHNVSGKDKTEKTLQMKTAIIIKQEAWLIQYLIEPDIIQKSVATPLPTHILPASRVSHRAEIWFKNRRTRRQRQNQESDIIAANLFEARSTDIPELDRGYPVNIQNCNNVSENQLGPKHAFSQQPEVRSIQTTSSMRSQSTPGKKYYSRKQLYELESRFQQQKYLQNWETDALASKLKLPYRQVRKWFWNERRRERQRERRRVGKTSKLTTNLDHAGSLNVSVLDRVEPVIHNSNNISPGQLGCTYALSQQQEVRSVSLSSSTKSETETSLNWKPRETQRCHFPLQQASDLESRFKRNRFPNKTDAEKLASSLNVTSMQVRSWFERRRTEFRRERRGKTLNLTAANKIQERVTVPVLLDSETFPPAYTPVPTNDSTGYPTSTVTMTASNDSISGSEFPNIVQQCAGTVPVANENEIYNNPQQHQALSDSSDCITPEMSAWQIYSSKYI